MSDDESPDQGSLVPSSGRNVSESTPGLIRRGLESLRVQQPRILHFPNDRALGTLYTRTVDELFDQHIDCYDLNNAHWKEFSEARGDVRVPEGRDLRLCVCADFDDPAALSALRTGDLLELELLGDSVSEQAFAQLNCLPGLRSLRLSGGMVRSMVVTDETISSLANLVNLRRLCLEWTTISDAGLKYLKGLVGLEELSLQGAKITGDGLSCLTHLDRLKKLDLSYTPIKNGAIRYIQEVIGLESLSLHTTEVNNEGLAHLRHLRGLQELDLSYTRIDDDGLKFLQGLTSLRLLDLRRIEVSDLGLRHLCNLINLETLRLRSRLITDAGLRQIEKLHGLQLLEILGASISDAGLSILSNFHDLEVLGLTDTPVSDAGLTEVGHMKSLRSLYLQNTNVSDAGMKHLRNLRELQYLDLRGTQVGVSGIRCFEERTFLTLQITQDQITYDKLVELYNTMPNVMWHVGDKTVPWSPRQGSNNG